MREETRKVVYSAIKAKARELQALVLDCLSETHPDDAGIALPLITMAIDHLLNVDDDCLAVIDLFAPEYSESDVEPNVIQNRKILQHYIKVNSERGWSE